MIINDNWKVESRGTLNVILFKKMTSKDKESSEEEAADKEKNEEDDDIGKEPGWRAVGYYADAKQAMQSLIRKEINGTGLKDFKEVVRKEEELMDMIKNIDMDGMIELEYENESLKRELEKKDTDSLSKEQIISVK